MKYRLAGIAAGIGLVVGYAGGAMMHFPPFPIQRLLQNPIADAAVVLLALGTVASLAVWAREPGRTNRPAFIAAATIFGGIAVIVNVVVPTLGWWAGMVFAGPLVPLALLTGLRAMFLVSIVLLLYRWLAARRQLLALLIYLLILLAVIPATIVGDQALLDSGVLVFGGGYTIWHDALFGVVLFALPLIFYEMFRRAGATRPLLIARG